MDFFVSDLTKINEKCNWKRFWNLASNYLAFITRSYSQYSLQYRSHLFSIDTFLPKNKFEIDPLDEKIII